MARTPGFLPVLLAAASLAATSAQTGADRRVGADEFGRPIVISAVDGRTIGIFARAAGVPMGLELAAAPPGQEREPVTVSGLSVADALQTIAAFDDRYEMRDMDGVYVLRPRDAWSAFRDPLAAPAPPVHLQNIRARNALSLIAALFGAPQYRDAQFGDTKRFSLNVAAGTVLGVLNATVRAHGRIAWSFNISDEPHPAFPYTVTLHSGAAGSGCGVPGTTPAQPVDPAQYADPVLFAVGGSPAALDRIVGNGPHDRPLVVNGPFPSAIRDLAKATKVSMGIEFLGPEYPSRSGSIPATGRTLRDVLDAIIAVDPRYEWREIQGVIAVRPAAAWHDPESVLFRLVPPVRLTNVHPQSAVEHLARALGHPHPLGMIPRGTGISLDEPQSSVLDRLNAILRVHGEMTWELSPLEPQADQDALRSGYRYWLTLVGIGGGGMGFAVR